jgi:hypothetical protein
MSLKTSKQIATLRKSLGCRISGVPFAAPPRAEPAAEEEGDEEEGEEQSERSKKKLKKGPAGPPMTLTQKFEIHQLVNSIHSSVGRTRNRATAELRNLKWLYDQIPYTDPSCNRGIVLGDMVQQSRFLALCLNPEAYRDPIILYVDNFDNKFLLDGLQTWSTVARVMDGALPIYIDEKVFLDAYPDLEIEGEPQKGLLFFSNLDNADSQVFYDFDRDSDARHWTVPKAKKKRERCLRNVKTWSDMFVKANSSRYQGCQFHIQLEDSQYLSESIVSKIMEDISVPVVELKKEHGWTLEDASAYVAEIMCNREPLCAHEVCMILNTPAVTVLKEIAQEERTTENLSRFFPDVRSGHFAVLLSAALLLKGGPGAPGTESSHHFVKSLAMDLELEDDDADALRVGLDLLGTMQKFPRPTKERIALVVAYLAKYRDTEVKDLNTVLNQTNKFLKGEEGGSQFLDSMKDNLMNSFLAMERLMGCEVEGAARTASFTPKEGDIEVIDLTEQ